MHIAAINLQVCIIKNGRIGLLRRVQMFLPQEAHRMELACVEHLRLCLANLEHFFFYQTFLLQNCYFRSLKCVLVYDQGYVA